MTANQPDPMLPTPFVVQKVKRETSDTYTLDLTRAEGATNFAFAPGQFNMLYAFGAGEVPISISGDPARPDTLVHTVRDVGNVTRAICRLKRGEVLGVRGPFGVPWPVDRVAGEDVLIIAGGLGLAPLRPALYHLLQQPGRVRQYRGDLRRPDPQGPALPQGTGGLARPLRPPGPCHRGLGDTTIGAATWGW